MKTLLEDYINDDEFYRKVNLGIFVTILVILIALLAVKVFSKKQTILPYYAENPQDLSVKKDICYFGLHSLLNKQAIPTLFEKDNIKKLNQTDYQIFHYPGIEAVGKPQIQNNICWITAKDARGTLVFRISFKASQNVFGLKIDDVEEMPLHALPPREEA